MQRKIPIEKLKEVIKQQKSTFTSKNNVYERINGKLLVLSKSNASNFLYGEPWACISIGAESGDWPKINKVQQIDILQLAFYDTESKTESNCFKEKHAEQILDFIDKVWDEAQLVMIHCLAGISRSPGVAASIAKIKYKNDDFYFNNYIPNTLVYKTILETANKRGLI
jgi:predicted protein tyrosine phosphatase